nr:uncharacterized protein LOC113711348 [Ipomoea batatas]
MFWYVMILSMQRSWLKRHGARIRMLRRLHLRRMKRRWLMRNPRMIKLNLMPRMKMMPMMKMMMPMQNQIPKKMYMMNSDRQG